MGPGGVGPGGATRLSSTPSTCTPAKWAGSSDVACRHGLIGDHTVFHAVPNWRASPEIVAPSKRNCRIAQRIARVPSNALGAHTFSLCSRNVTVSQVRSRHIQRSIVPPDSCRDPSPGRVDNLHYHTPLPLVGSPPRPGHPTSWLHDSTSSTRASGVRATLIRWKPSKPTSRSQRSSATEQQQVGRDTARGP